MKQYVTNDEWLSDVMGYRVSRLDFPDDLESVAFVEKDILEAAGYADRAMLYTKIPIGQSDRAHNLQRFGFVNVDLAVTFSRPSSSDQGEKIWSNVRVAKSGDYHRVMEIAEKSFRYSRFHSDREIEDRVADKIKREWMGSYSSGTRGVETLIVEHDGVIAGFLGVLQHDQQMVIDLIAIDPEYQGKGAGRALVETFNMKYKSSCESFLVGTQLANGASIRMYEKAGYRFNSANFVFHGHIIDGRWEK